MFVLGKSSIKALTEAHKDFFSVATCLMRHQIMDFAVREPYRDEITQNEAFRNGLSKVMYPLSKHNKKPSDAVHFIPYVNGKPSYTKVDAIRLAGHIEVIANQLEVNLRWGGNWDSDEIIIIDQKFNDLHHWEKVYA